MNLLHQLLTARGSTRSAALLRVGFVGIAWSRWANELLPFRDLTPPRLALSVAFFAATTWLLLGYKTRLAAIAVAGVVWIIVFGFGRIGGVEDWTHHHTTLIAYALVGLALTPCGHSFSLDRWLEIRRAAREGRDPAPEEGLVWGLAVLAVLTSTVYFWNAFHKTSIAFLSGARLEQIFVHLYASSDWAPPSWTWVLFAAAATTVVILEYLLAFGLWVRRWQWWLVPTGLALHGLFYVLIPVYTFSVTMWLLYLAYLDPDAVHRFLDRFLAPRPQQTAVPR